MVCTFQTTKRAVLRSTALLLWSQKLAVVPQGADMAGKRPRRSCDDDLTASVCQRLMLIGAGAFTGYFNKSALRCDRTGLQLDQRDRS